MVCVCVGGGGVIVLVPDHCLSLYLSWVFCHIQINAIPRINTISSFIALSAGIFAVLSKKECIICHIDKKV